MTMINSEAQLSPAKQALLQIRELKRQLAAAKQIPHTDIAIVSTACRFPRAANTPEAYWQMLQEGESQISEIPGDRWDLDAFFDEDSQVPGKMYSRWGAFLDRIDSFDAEFFGISPREATWVDPQQRLLLEVSWEALERAGWTANSLTRKTGVFVGWMHNDYQNEASDSFLNLNPYIATGAAGSFLSGRMAYYLGLEGPSLAVDTACSSSLVALHLACLSLSSGECDAAIVGGVNVIVSPMTNILTCKLQALSPQGHSLAFDARADGYVRGEGCGVVAIKRLADAERDGDPILAVINGSAVGHNGMSNGLTVPSSQAQERVIRDALRRAGRTGAEVDYLEAHGTGTSLGDPIELRAAAAALGEKRDPAHPLYVGSVKTNIGHLEAAAGMAGLIKVVASLQQGSIPPHLNFEQPNPHIPWSDIPVNVLTEPREWTADKSPLASVSAFGMSGTNAHVVVSGYSRHQRTSANARLSGNGVANGNGHSADTTLAHNGSPSTNGSGHPQPTVTPQLVVLSGRTEAALHEQVRRVADWFESLSTEQFTDAAYTLGAGRNHFDHRLAFVAETPADAATLLKSAGRSESTAEIFSGHAKSGARICWQFTGQGSQYLHMAEELYRSNERFRAAIDECEQWSRDLRNESLLDIMFGHEAELNDTRWTQPAIFAVQKGLVALLAEAGLRPDFVLGHSVGQYAAACTADVMSWQDGFFLICERGRCISELERSGTMFAVFASPTVVDEALAQHPDVSLAARNGTHQVISGRTEPVETLAEEFSGRGIRCKRLQTSHAFHSALMDPALAPFEQQAARVKFRQAAIPLVCNVSGNVLPADFEFTPAYWANHIRQAVRYSDGIQALQAEGCDLLLELGPQAVLTKMAKSLWSGNGSTLVSCLQKNAEDNSSLLSAIGQLYINGVTPDFRQLHSGQRQILLSPTYPFQRRRYWGPPKPKAAYSAEHTAHPLLGSSYSLAGVTNEQRFESIIEPDSPAWLPDHAVMEDVVFPGAALVEMALATGGRSLHNIHFEAPLQPQGRTRLQSIAKTKDDKTFEVYSAAEGEQPQWRRHLRCELDQQPERSASAVDLEMLSKDFSEQISTEEFYETLAGIGLHYGPAFRVIETLAVNETGVLAHLQVRGDLRGYTLPPTLLDGALHCLAVGLLRDANADLFLPVDIGSLTVHQPIVDTAICHAEWTQPEGDERKADLVLYDETGKLAVEIRELTVRRLSQAALRKMGGEQPLRLLYDIQWQEYRLPETEIEAKTWLVVEQADTKNSPLLTGLSKHLDQLGHRTIRILLDASQPELSCKESTYRFDGRSVSAWKQFLERLREEGTEELHGVVWLTNNADALSAIELADLHCLSLISSLTAMQEQGIRGLECGLQIVTQNGMTTGDADADAQSPVIPEQSQFWGFGRSLASEQPTFQIRLVDLANLNDERYVPWLADYVLNNTSENQIAIRDQGYFVPRLRRTESNSENKSAFPVSPEGACLITGGLGMLGRETARWLAEQGAGHIVLVSRRPPNESAANAIEELRSTGVQVTVATADSTERDEMVALLARFGSDLPPLKGVIHAAGMLDDGLIADQTSERYQKVLRPKLLGASLLHALTADCDLDFFVLYSSAASVLGSPGQTNYATANAFLDGLATARRQKGLPGLSVNWGPWTVGMAAEEAVARRMALQGIVPLDTTAHRILGPAIERKLSQGLVLDVDWRRLAASTGGMTPPLLSEVTPAKKRATAATSEFVSKLRTLPASERRTSLRDSIQLEFQTILGTEQSPETDRPVIEFGLDSLMAVEFSSRLQALLGEEYAIAPTMLFDYPTIDAITDYVLEQIGGDEAEAVAKDRSTPEQESQDDATPIRLLERENIAIVGLSCRFPGANSVEEYWQNLLKGVDAVGEIPPTRWDVEHFYSPERQPGKMYFREGGFVQDIDAFAAEFFNLSREEACWLDPQHRLLLENCWSALEDAGLPPHAMPDAAVGVFMGIMSSDYAFLPKLDDQQLLEHFQGAGFSHSAGVGRISHFFGFEGPSVSVDTASSSSLVAVYQAMRSLQERQCHLALAGGVNAILAPGNSLLMSKAGLLSPDGRCKSFSAAADGFGRGEGCGVVVLKREQDAIRDNDRILATLRGGAVAHNGTSGGVTMPNGPAQSRLIKAAWEDAGLPPKSAQYLEAHGTGTEYGDPMELNAAAAVLGRGRGKENPLLVGSVKANISHLEAAGGISGLIKAVLALHHGSIPRQLHFDQPSPHVPWKRLPVKMVTETTPWPKTEERIAAVTALGLSGTNAHVVLSAPAKTTVDVASPAAGETKASDSPQLLQWSARTPTALRNMVQQHAEHFKQHPSLALTDIATTLSRGRTHFEYRLALTVDSLPNAVSKLDELQLPADGEFELASHDGTWTAGKAESTPKQTWIFIPLSAEQTASLRSLFLNEPVFQKAVSPLLDTIDEHLAKSDTAECPLREWFESEEGAACPDAWEPVAEYMLHWGLASLLKSAGQMPDTVAGCGAGQYVASCLAGVLKAEDAVRLVLQQSRTEADNADSLKAFEQFADRFDYYPPGVNLWCSLDGEQIPLHRTPGGSYWRRHATESPEPEMLQKTVRDQTQGWLVCMGGTDDTETTSRELPLFDHSATRPAIAIRQLLGRLYIAGFAVDATQLSSPGKKVSLPTYPFERQRYWITDLLPADDARRINPASANTNSTVVTEE